VNARSVVRVVILVAAVSGAAGAVTRAGAQTLAVTGGTTSQVVPSPTALIYDAAPTGNVTGSNTTTNLTLTATCASTGNPGCQLDLAFGANPVGGQLQVQWQLVSFTGADCGSLSTGGPFKSIPATKIWSANKHSMTCTLTFAFQVAGLSYSQQPAPGPGGVSGPYVQGLTFTVH
jgi:hypothetical protein